jgi:hypothetical protein
MLVLPTQPTTVTLSMLAAVMFYEVALDAMYDVFTMIP